VTWQPILDELTDDPVEQQNIQAYAEAIAQKSGLSHLLAAKIAQNELRSNRRVGHLTHGSNVRQQQ